MTKSVSLILFLACFALLPGCKKDSTGPENGQGKTITDLLVKNSEIGGWTYFGSGWTANNLTELTVKIDGASDIYQRHGFIEAASQDFQGNVNSAAARLSIMVFNQGTTSNAAALYADPAIGFSGALSWTTCGNAAHYVRNGGLSQELAFTRNGYYVYVNIDHDTDESLSVIQQFALNLDGKIQTQ